MSPSCLASSSEVSVRDLLAAVRDGWQPAAETAGQSAADVLKSMTWTGRTAAKRMVKAIYSDMDWAFRAAFVRHIGLVKVSRAGRHPKCVLFFSCARAHKNFIGYGMQGGVKLAAFRDLEELP